MKTKTILKTNLPPDAAKSIAAGVLEDNGYKFTLFRNQKVWRHNLGLVFPQLFTITAENGNLVVESWASNFIIPGIYFGESGLASIWNFLPKISMKEVLVEIADAVLAKGAKPRGYFPKGEE
ncbi:MAG: hypothetical protein LBP62_00625 [Clostridiales bacterium]|jgi:hypothetical protein|nr:hypothetical protein [Clostridiales bacterium]